MTNKRKDWPAGNKGRNEGAWLATASLVILAGVALAFALAYTRAIMIPFVLALFIVTIVSPILDFQVLYLRFPRFIAVLTTLTLVVAVIVMMSFLVAGAVHTVATEANKVKEDVVNVAEMAYGEFVELRSWFDGKFKTKSSGDEGIDPNVDPNLDPNAVLKVDQAVHAAHEPPKDPMHPYTLEITPDGFVYKEVPEPNVSVSVKTDQDTGQSATEDKPSSGPREDILKLIDQLGERVLSLLLGMGSVVFGLMRSALFVAIFMIFFLAGRNPRVIRTGVYADIDHKIRKYIGTKLAISAATGILVWASLKSIGLNFANVFGILAFLLNFIPSIGSIISSFLPLPIAIAQVQGIGQSANTGSLTENPILFVILVLAVPGLIQMVLGTFLEPKILGEGLNLHPVTILLALSFWGLLWGVAGMFLAAPITAVIRIILMQFDTLKPVGNALAGKLPEVELLAEQLPEAEALAGELPEAKVPAGELPEAKDSE
jgi:AI-2 transport protein TqsA